MTSAPAHSRPFAPDPDHAARVDVGDAVMALALVGDLSMGQPLDHSVRTAWLACELAAQAGLGAAAQAQAHTVALLRWSGCTANAPEIAELMGDDVGGRNAMLSAMAPGAMAHLAHAMGRVAAIHCEVSGDVARSLGLPSGVEQPLRRIFEAFDGGGKPAGWAGHDIPVEVFVVNIAGDLEIMARVHGLDAALHCLRERAGRRYPAPLVDLACASAPRWLDALRAGAVQSAPAQSLATAVGALAPLELIADVIDLKIPWMAGFSRQAAHAAAACAAALGLEPADQGHVYRAALLHGMGRASVPNAVWNAPCALGDAELEQLRLVPYWTSRAGRRIPGLGAEAELASYVDERLDGSGGFRGATANALGVQARVLAAAVQWVWLRTARPGHPALDGAQAAARLQRQADEGLLDAAAVAALTGTPAPRPPLATAQGCAAPAGLTARETEVLRRITLGESNKEAARHLGISPSTVRAHLENVFRKLECSSRAAATLKALTLGIL